MDGVGQKVMDSAYEKYCTAQSWSDRFSVDGITGTEIAVTLLGNFNYQVENGGIFQWWDNGYALEHGANGRSAYVALAALAVRHRDLDPEFSDVIVEGASIVSTNEGSRKSHAAGSLANRSYDEEDDGDDEEWSFESSGFETRFSNLGQDRRLAFIDRVAEVHPKDIDPFDASFTFHARPSTAEGEIRYPQVNVALVGEDSNGFMIVSRVARALRLARVPEEEIKAYMSEATSGDYAHLLDTTMRWVSCGTAEPKGPFRR